MFSKNKIISSLVGLGFFLALIPNVALANNESEIPVGGKQTNFQKIEQPIGLKFAVALGGLGLIGAELWWFIFSKTKSQKAFKSKT